MRTPPARCVLLSLDAYAHSSLATYAPAPSSALAPLRALIVSRASGVRACGRAWMTGSVSVCQTRWLRETSSACEESGCRRVDVFGLDVQGVFGARRRWRCARWVFAEKRELR